MIPFAANDLPTTDAMGCRLPFGIGFMAFLAIAVLAGFAAVALIFGQVEPVPNPPLGDSDTSTERAARNAALDALPDSFATGGSATTSVSGTLTTSGQIAADPIRSYIQDGTAWLGFGDLADGAGVAEILVVLNEPEDSVTVAQGELAAIGQDDDCTWDIKVTLSTISGTVSCAAAEVWRNTIEATGTTASIQLNFSTTLEPMEE